MAGELSGEGVEARTYAFDVADDPLLSPLLLYVSLYGILAGKGRLLARLAEQPGAASGT